MVMHNLEIKHLKLIKTISETRNMTKAASRLFITQSALSQQLKGIEEKLEVKLFSRNRKKMILTNIGKKVLVTAHNVLETLEDTELEIAQMVSGDTGEIKVGTQCVFCYKWLPDAMGKFRNSFPNIDFEIGSSDDVLNELESEKYDLIVTGAPLNDTRLTYQPLFEDQMVCIMPSDHPLTAKPFVDYQDFNNESLILNSERGKQLIQQTKSSPGRFMIVNQPQAIIEMVIAGFGLSVFPRWAVKPQVDKKLIAARPITKTCISLTWNIVYLDRNLSVPQREFINIVSKLNIRGAL
ncbi:MAG: LysR family transcriptional regulator [Deltaproteobacteria bacterium]|nr:LysR family transcriptional regulator [Deltaproteobacteria bacterium]